MRPAPGTRDQVDLTWLSEAIGKAILGSESPDSPALRPAEPGDHLSIVRRAAEAEQVSRDLLHSAVGAARGSGHSWSAIGSELGMSRQAVQQRFKNRPEPPENPEYRWLGPVTAFDELPELELAGRMGWHTVGAGMLRHRMIRTQTQWQHRRVVWTGSLRKYHDDGWQVGCRAFPWIYLIRDLGTPAAPEPPLGTTTPATTPPVARTH